MIKKLLPYAKKYRLPAIMSPLCIIFEVLIEVTIPLMMSIEAIRLLVSDIVI